MKRFIVTTVLVAVTGMAGCERRPDSTPPSRTPQPGTTSGPEEKVVLTPEQVEEMARAKVLLALLGKGSPEEQDKVDPAPEPGH